MILTPFKIKVYKFLMNYSRITFSKKERKKEREIVMLRDLQIWIEIIFPINSSTVRRRCCSKRIAQRIRDRRRLLVSFVFLSRVCSKLYLPPTSRNSIVVQLRIDR